MVEILKGGPQLPERHPRLDHIAKADREIRDAFYTLVTKWNLSAVESIAIAAGLTSDIAKHSMVAAVKAMKK